MGVITNSTTGAAQQTAGSPTGGLTSQNPAYAQGGTNQTVGGQQYASPGGNAVTKYGLFAAPPVKGGVLPPKVQTPPPFGTNAPPPQLAPGSAQLNAPPQMSPGQQAGQQLNGVVSGNRHARGPLQLATGSAQLNGLPMNAGQQAGVDLNAALAQRSRMQGMSNGGGGGINVTGSGAWGQQGGGSSSGPGQLQADRSQAPTGMKQGMGAGDDVYNTILNGPFGPIIRGVIGAVPGAGDAAQAGIDAGNGNGQQAAADLGAAGGQLGADVGNALGQTFAGVAGGWDQAVGGGGQKGFNDFFNQNMPQWQESSLNDAVGANMQQMMDPAAWEQMARNRLDAANFANTGALNTAERRLADMAGRTGFANTGGVQGQMYNDFANRGLQNERDIFNDTLTNQMNAIGQAGSYANTQRGQDLQRYGNLLNIGAMGAGQDLSNYREDHPSGAAMAQDLMKALGGVAGGAQGNIASLLPFLGMLAGAPMGV